ncbi:MAG: four helix bundle protein [Burkholderiales bacterium]
MRRQHQELLAWKLAVERVTDLYELTSAFPPTETYGLTAQVRRAAVSGPSKHS